MIDKELAAKFLKHFGCDNQIDKLVEELVELTHELIQFKKLYENPTHLEKTNRVTNILSECYDVEFLIEQMKQEVGSTLVDDIYFLKQEKNKDKAKDFK
jgi:hypothetical protein